MATASLIDTGVKLGRTSGQLVKLGDLRRDGYTRTKAGFGYLAVNPYEVQAGKAGDPDEAGSLHRLGDWAGYGHSRLPAASDLEDLEGGYDAVDVAWVAPPGASRAPELVGFRVYIKDTGTPHTSSPGDPETSTDPTSSPDKTVDVGFGASVVEALETSFTPAGNWMAVAVVSLFDDSVTEHEDTEGASAKAGEVALTGAFEGILAKVFSASPTIEGVRQNPLPDDCLVGSNVDIFIDVLMEGGSQGTLQESVNGGAFSTIDSNVTAGAQGELGPFSRASGNNYQYRLRYNDVSPNQWDTSTVFSAACNNL